MLIRRHLLQTFCYHYRQKSNSLRPFKEIPAPRALPLIGTTLDFLLNGHAPHLHTHVDKRHRQLGPIFKEALGPVYCVFLASAHDMRAVFAHEGKHPVHLQPDAWTVYNKLYGCRRGLFFMDGDEWAHHRKIMNKLLLRNDDNFAWIERCCDSVNKKLMDNLLKCNNLEQLMYTWSLSTICAILTGPKTCRNNEQHLELELLAGKVRRIFETSAKLQFIPADLAARWRLPRWKRFVHSVDEALDGANSLIDKLLNLNHDPDGLLPKLLNENIELSKVRSIIADLILAAGDTTAYAMQWMLYSIAKNANIQVELRGMNSETNQQFARNVMRETLRLYPVAPFLTRILPKDVVIAGYEVPKHTLIVLSIYTSGRNELYYKNALEFNPNRWDRDDEFYNADMQRASLPFAMGLRSCIGRKIAEIQLQRGLLEIVNKFNVKLAHEKEEVDVVLKMVAVPSRPIQLKFEEI